MRIWLKLLPWLLLISLFAPLLMVPFADRHSYDNLQVNGELADPTNFSPSLQIYRSDTVIPNSIDEILSIPARQQWHENKKNYVNQGFVLSTQWVSATLSNPSAKPLELLMEFRNPRIESLSLYRLDSNDTDYQVVYEDLGITNSQTASSVDYRNIVNPLTLAPHSATTLYWRIAHKGDLRYQIYLWSPDAFHNYVQREQLFFGVIYGLLGMMVFYNLFVFFIFKEKSHLYFVFYAMISIFYLGVIEGHIYQYLFLLPIKSGQWVLLTALASTQVIFALFARRFLNLRRWANSLHMATLLVALASAFMFIIGMYSPIPLLVYSTAILLSITLYALVAYASYIIWRRGDSSAGYFGLAVLFLLLSLSAGVLTSADLISLQELPYNFISIGHIAMVLIFALALAEKIKQLHEERVNSSMELVKLSEEKLKINVDFYKNKIQESELQRSSEQSVIENRTKTEFLATMSHEIRTPMSGVLGMTELLMDTKLSQQQQHFVQSIHNSGQALISIINDLLDYSKIEAGKMEVESLVFNLEELVDDCIALFALRATDKPLNLVGGLKPNTQSALRGDPTKLRQIILNLLNNAYGFSTNGEISLSVYQTDKKSINSVEIRFEVHDGSFTLNKEEQAALFQPFSQSESGSSRKFSGTSLGLAICKQLTELMHGDMSIDSNQEAGTTFWFTARLPLPHSDELAPQEDRSSLLRGKRLLVVDDYQPSAKLLKMLTESWGMTTDTCSNAAQAENTLRDREPYHFVILPGDSNDQPNQVLYNALRSGNYGYVPRLIGIAQSNRLPTQSADITGFNHFLIKPVTSKQLFTTLAESLGAIVEFNKPVDSHKLHEFSRINVLVAEDNKVNQMVIVGLLNKLHITPTNAANGREVLDRYHEAEVIDLILMDCEMPEMDGYEATRHIRQEEEKALSKHTLIVALSAHSIDEYKEKALAAGMDDYLTKPITKEDIERILERYFSEDSGQSSEKNIGT